MPSFKSFAESPFLRVTLDRLQYQAPTDHHTHCFVYFLSIHNDGDRAVTIRGRKWVVRDPEGGVTAVEGQGVVGQMPTIEPGGTFSYHSYHLVQGARAVAEGSYLGVDEDGHSVLARIPAFEMVVPEEDPT